MFPGQHVAERAGAITPTLRLFSIALRPRQGSAQMSTYAVTSTLGTTFLNLGRDGDDPQVVNEDQVSSMNGEYNNMRQIGYKTGVCALC